VGSKSTTSNAAFLLKLEPLFSVGCFSITSSCFCTASWEVVWFGSCCLIQGPTLLPISPTSFYQAQSARLSVFMGLPRPPVTWLTVAYCSEVDICESVVAPSNWQLHCKRTMWQLGFVESSVTVVDIWLLLHLYVVLWAYAVLYFQSACFLCCRHPTPLGLQAAKKLALNLIETVSPVLWFSTGILVC
jgi:hypothetical protein